MYCKNCGTENGELDKFCKNCGQPLTSGGSQQGEPSGNTRYSPDPAPVQYTAYQQTTAAGEDKPSATAIAAMIMGIVSIVFCCMNIISVVLGVVAVVLAKKEEKEGHHNGFVKAGFICGLIGAILGGLYLIYIVIMMVFRVASNVSFR